MYVASQEVVFIPLLVVCTCGPQCMRVCGVCVQEMLKHCPEPQYRWELQEALDAMLKLLKSVNDSMHQIAITGYQVLRLIRWRDVSYRPVIAF